MSWITQNTHCIFSPGPAVDSSQTSSMASSRYAPSKSRSTSRKSSPRDFQALQSGMMSKPFEPTTRTAPRRSRSSAPILTNLLLPEASLAKTSLARDAARAYTANVAAYGESMLVSFARYDQDLSLWKIHPCLFDGDLATFSGILPHWGMMRHGVLFRLPPWEPCTYASDSGSLLDKPIPTPTVNGNNNRKGVSAKSSDGLMTYVRHMDRYPTVCAHDAMAQSGKPHGWQRNGKEAQQNLNDLVVRMSYPTPTAKDANGPWHTTHSPSLNVVATSWPTPCATDAKGPGKTPRDRLDYAVNGATKSATYPTIGCKTMGGTSGSFQKLQKLKEAGIISEDERRCMASGSCGQLNPDWVEWLMFWPIGWTDCETPNHRLYWLDPSIDPASPSGRVLFGLYIPRTTTRCYNRAARIKELGNGQFPLTASVALWWGCNMLTLQKARGALQWS